MFDTNKYANNPKTDFLNWAVINAGTFDYAGDAWGYTYGAAAEWYQGRFTLRAGVFDLSATPAGGADNAPAYSLDPSFNNFQLVGEIEERHELWGQPGKIKITGFLNRGDAGNFSTPSRCRRATGLDASDALAAVRSYRQPAGRQRQPGATNHRDLGVFARAGWADGNVEPWDFTDIDRTVEAGVSFNGKPWGRPDDTVGIAGVSTASPVSIIAYFNAGGLGILIGDGQLPNPRPRADRRDLLQLRAAPRRPRSASTISSSPTPATTPIAVRRMSSPGGFTRNFRANDEPDIAMRWSVPRARWKWPRIAAFVLLVLLLAGAGCHAHSPGRLPMWVEIVGFIAISSAIAILVEWGGKPDRRP